MSVSTPAEMSAHLSRLAGNQRPADTTAAVRAVAFRMLGAQLSGNIINNAGNVPARDGWEGQVARLNTSSDNGPEGVYGPECIGLFRPDRSETR